MGVGSQPSFHQIEPNRSLTFGLIELTEPCRNVLLESEKHVLVEFFWCLGHPIKKPRF